MYKLNSKEDVLAYVTKKGLTDADKAQVEALTGGVSSMVWKVTMPSEKWVIKQSLEQLKVSVDWFSDQQRIYREQEAMEALYWILPEGSVPKLLFEDRENYIYMMTCAPEDSTTWKERLLEGDLSLGVAKQVGSLLKQMHQKSQEQESELRENFDDLTYFEELRIDPFHRHLIKKYPELEPSIQRLIDQLTKERSCLVHGDYSPKNLLVDETGHVVVLDFEVAHWGNPVFDVAFCVGHLLLKGWSLQREQEAFDVICSFFTGYEEEITPYLLPHLGLMLLARMDGKSPINYITDSDAKDHIRQIAMTWLTTQSISPKQQIEEALIKGI